MAPATLRPSPERVLELAIVSGTVGDEVLAYVRQQLQTLGRHDAVAADEPDAVHAARVATRRLRSTLRTFPIFEPAEARKLRRELGWYAHALAAARDSEVLLESLEYQIEALPAPLRAETALTHLREHLAGARAKGLRELRKAQAGERFEGLLRHLDRFRARPPLTPQAGQEAHAALLSYLEPALVAPVELAAELGEGPGRDVMLHEVRKLAKVARYACEAARGVYGESAAVLARGWESVTEELGVAQDTAVALRVLARVSRECTAGESTDSLAELRRVRQERGRVAEEDGLAALVLVAGRLPG